MTTTTQTKTTLNGITYLITEVASGRLVVSLSAGGGDVLTIVEVDRGETSYEAPVVTFGRVPDMGDLLAVVA